MWVTELEHTYQLIIMRDFKDIHTWNGVLGSGGTESREMLYYPLDVLVLSAFTFGSIWRCCNAAILQQIVNGRIAVLLHPACIVSRMQPLLALSAGTKVCHGSAIWAVCRHDKTVYWRLVEFGLVLYPWYY